MTISTLNLIKKLTDIRHLFLLLLILFASINSNGQRIERDTICARDTVLVQGNWTYPKNFHLPDPSNSFLATYCDYRKSYGLRFDFAFSQYVFSKPMADWIGYHQGTNLNMSFAFQKLNIGMRFKPWTTKPKSELIFDGNMLPKNADVNPFRFDFYLGYEFDVNSFISVEPSVGYTICTFKVINEKEINQSFLFNKTQGLLVGITINKYIIFDNYKYFVLFGRVNYGFVDYSEVHQELNGGYTEICLGISYKFYWRYRIYNVVKKRRIR